MKLLTNQTGIPLSLAVWLATDTYKHNPNPNAISATSLIQPIRSIVLARQNRDLDQIGDIVSLVASQSGTAYHDGIRNAWLSPKLKETLKTLNYSDTVINRIVVNPPSGYEAKEDDIIIWTEIRTEKTVDKFLITGKLDFCAEGNLEDHKSTSVYALIFGSNAESYSLQGSIYRWLNPDKITGESVQINYIFTDWSKSAAMRDKEYPQKRILAKQYPLMSIQETDTWIKGRLQQIALLSNAPQHTLPLCTKEELWQSDSVFKYYKDPTKTARSTKNFDNMADAQTRLGADGHVGKVLEVVGQVKKCQFCKVNTICDQAKDLVATGLLIL